MQETPYAEKQVHTEDGKPLDLSYSILSEGEGSNRARYGVRIVERNSGSHAFAPGLTTDKEQILALIETLVRNAVTPTGLMDVIEDWRE